MLERLKLFASDQDGDMATTCGYVAVQSAWSGDVGDGRKRYMRPVRLSGIARRRKEFLPEPLPSTVAKSLHLQPTLNHNQKLLPLTRATS